MPNDAEHRTLLVRMIEWMAARFPHATISAENLEAYVEDLWDLDPLTVAAGARALINNGAKFMPLPGEIRRAAELASGSQRASALEAWGMVKREMQRVGSRRRPEQLDPVTLAAIEAVGGWEAFGQSDTDDEPSWRAQFVRAYDTIATRQDAAASMQQVRLQVASGAGTLAQLLAPTRTQPQLTTGSRP